LVYTLIIIITIIIILINNILKHTVNRKKMFAATSYCNSLKKNSFHFECLKLLSDRSLLLIDADMSFQAAGPQVYQTIISKSQGKARLHRPYVGLVPTRIMP